MLRTKATNKRIRAEIQHKRKEVIDVLGGKCEVCSFSNKNILEIHHILPISKGGDNNWNNLSVLCPNCHRSIHDLINTVNPERDLKKYFYHYMNCWNNFISVFRKTLMAISKQNKVNAGAIRKKLNHLEKKIDKNDKEIEHLKRKNSKKGGLL